MNNTESETNSLFPEDQEMGFTVYSLEDVLAANREVTAKPQRNDFYQVAWVSSGNGITVVDGKNYRYGDNYFSETISLIMNFEPYVHRGMTQQSHSLIQL